MALTALAGCGGGGSSPSPSPTPTPSPAAKTATPHIAITWGARSRSLSPPESAVSAVITLHGAAVGGGDIAITADRSSSTNDPLTQTYAASALAVQGSYAMTARFYANAGGTGAVVASGSAQAQIDSTGLLPDVALTGTITAVTIAPNQSVLVGHTADLSVAANDASGTIIAVTPGSIFLNVNGAALRNVGGGPTVQGLSPGTATVTATIDGIASPSAAVAAITNTTVSLSPSGPVAVGVGQTVQFSATVTNIPTGAATGVNWSVQEGAVGGTVTQSGLYTAPTTPGTYHVVAVSQYDPAHQATATVSVQSGGVNVGVNFPGSGGVDVGVN